jgi:signal transduction histidine kinase
LRSLDITPNIDSLKEILITDIDNESRGITLFQITVYYINNNLDSSLKYIKQFNQVPLKSKVLELHGLNIMGDIFLRLGNASMALETISKALKIGEEMNDSAGLSMVFWNLGKVYQSLDDNTKAISYCRRSMQIATAAHEGVPQSQSMAYLGLLYMNLNRPDSALYYTRSAYEIRRKMKNKNFLPLFLAQLGDVYQKSGNSNLALQYYRAALEEASQRNNLDAAGEAYIGIAGLFKKDNINDSCYYYAKKGFVMAQQVNNAALILKAGNFLKVFFKDKNLVDSAFKYQEIMISKRDSVEKIRKVQDISLAEQKRIQEIEAQKKDFQTKIKLYTLIISLAVFLFVAIFLYRNNRQKQKVNVLLQHQKEQIQHTFQELKSTQAQLIHQEKMASLGELTAGIAHEIQNPLNFVNNFSEVNRELIAEMKEEIKKGNIDEIKLLANDLDENEEKILLHGKRADSIVKGMLQHSRASTGQKELTDINKLADEYLRLSYHGMRAKDKSFNAEFKTDFDETIGKIYAVPQDIGRVLLNLFNNAFYAVSKPPNPLKGSNDYEPTVSISTKRLDGKILISVKDNGPGIPQNIVDKIFQPFFTTKPTGQGTGLGLSLAYDIIKAHGGEIKVETKDGGGSEFVIELPIK